MVKYSLAYTVRNECLWFCTSHWSRCYCTEFMPLHCKPNRNYFILFY